MGINCKDNGLLQFKWKHKITIHTLILLAGKYQQVEDVEYIFPLMALLLDNLVGWSDLD